MVEPRIYVIYYEGRHEVYAAPNESLRWVNPRKGDALARAKEIPLYLKSGYRVNVPEKNVILIDGGYRENFSLDIWIAPKDSKPPKLTPTLTEKNIKFRKGKPYKVRNLAGCL